MIELVNSIVELVRAVGNVLLAVSTLGRPILPLLFWMAFWYFAVDWIRLRRLLGAGGWTVPLLVSVFGAVIRWITAGTNSTVLPFGPTTTSPFVAAVAWTSLLAALAMVCGAAQVSRRASEGDEYEI